MAYFRCYVSFREGITYWPVFFHHHSSPHPKKSWPHHNSLRLNSSSTAFLRMELCTTAMWNHNPSPFGTDINLVKRWWRKKTARQYIPGPPFGVFFGVSTKNMTQARSREHNKRGDTKIQKNNTKTKTYDTKVSFRIFWFSTKNRNRPEKTSNWYSWYIRGQISTS